MEETRIPFLGVGHAVDGVGSRVVVVVEHGQSVAGLEGVNEVLCGLVEVPSARPHLPASVQHVAPVGAAIERVVVLIVGVLHGEDALLRVLVLGQEDVAEVLQVAILRVLHIVGVLHHFLHVLLVDVAHTGGLLIAIAPCHGEVALGQIGCGGNLVGASALLLLCGEHVVGGLEVGNDFLHQLLVGELVVGALLLGVVLVSLLVNPGHLVPQLHELEVEVGAQEANLALANLACLLVHRAGVFGQRDECAVAA